MVRIPIADIDGAAGIVFAKVWYKSRELWSHFLGLIAILAPIILDNIGMLGLSPWQVMYWTVGVMTVKYVVDAMLRLTSRNILVSGKTMRAAQNAAAQNNPNENSV